MKRGILLTMPKYFTRGSQLLASSLCIPCDGVARTFIISSQEQASFKIQGPRGITKLQTRDGTVREEGLRIQRKLAP